MEKETVLEIEFKELWNNKFAWKIIKQDEKILEKGEFIDRDIKVESSFRPEFDTNKEILYIRGMDELSNDKINICTAKDKKIIEEKVKAINEKHGIKKRWRAEKGHYYYFVDNNYTSIFAEEDKCSTEDDDRFENGNYFKIPEEAEEYAEYMKKCSLEWHEKRCENE